MYLFYQCSIFRSYGRCSHARYTFWGVGAFGGFGNGRILPATAGGFLRKNIRDFESHKNGAVSIELIEVDYTPLREDIVNEATSRIGLYDGYVAAPSITGEVVARDGWADLKPYIEESPDHARDWADILVNYRTGLAQYENKIIMYPLDGDLLTMYYRKDILEHFGLGVPRTWDEYNRAIRRTHGQVYENKTLVGSCVGRSFYCGNNKWAHLMLSQMTQTQGAWEGHAFDTADMSILGGEAMERALEWLEVHVRYGAQEEFDECIDITTDYLNSGHCVLAYNWGNTFKRYLEEGSVLRGDRFGIAPTPGSTMVLDRTTRRLVDCNETLCRRGVHYDDIGWVNRAPFLAYGGYSCAVNNYTDPVYKRLATEFCAFAASKEQSKRAVIRNASSQDLGGQDPFRQSHLNVDEYTQMGYEAEASGEFVNAYRDGLEHPNAVIDLRFPSAWQIFEIVETTVFDYLNRTKHEILSPAEQALRRKQAVSSMEAQMREMIVEYDSERTNDMSILESYQRLRGVYRQEVNLNQLGSIRAYGYTLLAVSTVFATMSVAWVLMYRRTYIVRASQPFFLVLISVGAAMIGSAIIPMGIDDSVTNEQGCSMACMSIPWLLVLGWTIVFSALFAKLRRMNLVYNHAMNFRRVTVTEKDVLYPFAILVTCNLALLLSWTFLNPLTWKRYNVSKTESYGKCTSSGEVSQWRAIISLIAIVNALALIFVNVEAYRARRIATEYGESRWIALSAISILQIVIVGIPILFLVTGSPQATYFIECTIAFIISMSILLWIYVPKVKAWRERRNETAQAAAPSQPGLAFRRRASSSGVQQLHEIRDMKAKLASLQCLLMEKGYDVDALFNEVGLDVDLDISYRNIIGCISRTGAGRLEDQVDKVDLTGKTHERLSELNERMGSDVREVHPSGNLNSSGSIRSSSSGQKLLPIIEDHNEESLPPSVEDDGKLDALSMGIQNSD